MIRRNSYEKKVLFLIYQLTGGGAERKIVDIVNNINRSLYDVTVQTIIDCTKEKYLLNNDIQYKYTFRGIVKEDRVFFKIFYAVNPKLLHNLFIKEKYDIEIAALEGIPTKIISGADNSINKIAIIHADAKNIAWPTKRYKNIIEENKSYERLNKIIFVSENSKNSFIEKFDIDINKIIVLNNPFDIKKIQHYSKEIISDYILPPNKIIFCAIGRLEYVKGFDRLIKAFAEVYNTNNNIELIIIGEGPERNALENIIKYYKLENVIKLLGNKINPYKYLKMSDCYICSSYSEGLSSTVIEAMIVGKPIIATDCGGMWDIYQENEWFTIVDNDYNGLKQGIKNFVLLNKKNKKVNYEVTKFSYETYFTKFEKIL